MIEEILRELNESDLLNQIGRILANQPELFPETFYEMRRFFEGQDEEQISNQLATSSLVGADDKLAIEDWIDEDEQEKMKKLAGIEEKKAYIQIRIEESLKNEFYSKCEENFQTPSVVLRGLIKKFVEGKGKC